MLPALLLIAATACQPGTEIAALQAAVAAPPADKMAQIDSADNAILIGGGFVGYLVEGPGVGDGMVLIVETKDGCVIAMQPMPAADYETMLAGHKS